MQYTTNAVFSYYAFQKYQMLTAASVPITTMTTTPAVSAVLTNMALGGTVGVGTAAVTTTVLGTSATVAVLGATAIGATAIAAAPLVITGAIIGGLFSFFND